MRAVNLIAGEQRVSPLRGRAGVGAYALVGGLAAALVLVLVYVLVANGVRSKEAELATARAEERAAEAEAAQLRPYLTLANLTATRERTVRALAASRFDWDQALREVARVVPEDVTLERLAGTVAPSIAVAGRGRAASGASLRAARAQPAIELSGCADTQTNVARLMSRLRAVDGVTRVSLASSTKPESRPQRPRCSASQPALFDLVAFFEQSTATPAAIAAGAPGAAGAAPAPGVPGTAGAAAPAPARTTTGTTG